MKPVIAITCGDFNGIGPEIVLKSLRSRPVRSLCTPVIVGPKEVFAHYGSHLGRAFRLVPFSLVREQRWKLLSGRTGRDVPLFVSSSVPRTAIRPGRVTAPAGEAATRAIERALLLVQLGIAQALVTAPVSKQALHLAGVNYPGQTEMLQALTGSPGVAMMLVSPSLRVGLVTIHLPLSRVAPALSRDLIRSRIAIIHRSLIEDWNIRRPRLAVLGLNPHAGEGGDLGMEERSIILPALHAIRNSGIQADGPFPADAFFARYRPGQYDAVVAMYHDQGLIPLKMSAAGRGVNFSAGLPVVRTSPDHGTAPDLAGRGKADPSSMIEAIVLAVKLSHHRLSFQRRGS